MNSVIHVTSGPATVVRVESSDPAEVLVSQSTGPRGPAGPAGTAGPGVPAAGLDGQVLVKLGTADYATAWANVPGLTPEADPVFAAWLATVTPANWNTAYGWGNHAGLYAVVGHNHSGVYAPASHAHSGVYDPAGTAAGAVSSHESTYNHANFATAYGWGNHATAGYLTGYAETDPEFKAWLGNRDSSNWDTAYGWGDHAEENYLVNETDPEFSAWLLTVTPANWNTAYSWGNHAGLYAAASHSHSGTYQPADADLTALAALSATGGFARRSAADTWEIAYPTESIGIACSDETTALAAGNAKLTFRMPYAFTLTAVRASVTTAPSGATIIVDINENGSTILSTKLSIDSGEKTSTTAATAAVISDAALADDAEITIDIDQVGSATAGAGLKLWLIGTRT